MGRNLTNTVEYFPHIAKPGKTLFILESQYGNDGYATWFKLLEILSATENHFYNADNPTDWHYLVSKFKVSPETATEILNLLSDLGNINKHLWKRKKIIWCQALVDNLGEVYRKRKRELPRKPFCDSKTDNCDSNRLSAPEISAANGLSAPESTQSKVEESRVKKSKVNNPPIPPRKNSDKNNGDARPSPSPKPSSKKKTKTEIPEDFTISKNVRSWAEGKYDNLELYFEAFRDRALAKGYEYADWDRAFMVAIREDWGGIRKREVSKSEDDGPHYKPFIPPPPNPDDVTPDPDCKTCHGRGIHKPPGEKKHRPCDCLHPVGASK